MLGKIMTANNNDSLIEKSVVAVEKAMKEGHKRGILYAIPVVLLLWLIFANLFANRIIIPTPEKYSVATNSDLASDSGNSIVSNLKQSDTAIQFTYTLKKGVAYPYAGVAINILDSTTFTGIDISKCDYMDISIGAKGKHKTLTLYFSTLVDGFSTIDNGITWRVYEKNLTVEEGVQKYRIDLKTFLTPQWWFRENGISADEFPYRNLKNCLSFVVENGEYDTNEPVTVTIEKMLLHKDLNTFNIALLSILITYSLLYIYFLNFGISHFNGPIVIPYKQLDISSYADEDTRKIEGYVAEKFSDSELVVKKISSETGITQAKIQVILKNQFKMTFRQYLNQIRLHEAKRLLLETDRQVTDIAYRVGYKNVTHFNRIFKDTQGMSPNQYRKANNSNKDS